MWLVLLGDQHGRLTPLRERKLRIRASKFLPCCQQYLLLLAFIEHGHVLQVLEARGQLDAPLDQALILLSHQVLGHQVDVLGLAHVVVVGTLAVAIAALAAHDPVLKVLCHLSFDKILPGRAQLFRDPASKVVVLTDDTIAFAHGQTAKDRLLATHRFLPQIFTLHHSIFAHNKVLLRRLPPAYQALVLFEK